MNGKRFDYWSGHPAIGGITEKLTVPDLEKLAAECTPAPWHVVLPANFAREYYIGTKDGEPILLNCHETNAPNPELVVALRNALPELLELLHAARQDSLEHPVACACRLCEATARFDYGKES